MFEHKKKLLHPVKVERPNPQYAVLMQEQLGGCNGEVKAAMQYLSQSFRAKDPVFKDLFLDIGTEELSHMEMVAETINLLNGGDVDYKKVDAGEIETLTKEIQERDHYDSTRDVSPLKQAEDAVRIDTTGKSIPEVVAAIKAVVLKKGYLLF